MVLPELTTYLATQGIGTAGTNLFYGILPDTPDALVTLFEYGGFPNEPDLGTGGTTTRFEYPRIQMLCRGVKDDYDGPRLKAQQVVAALTAVVNTTLSGIYYISVIPLQAPFFLRRDENFRVEFACNFQVSKGNSAS